MNIWAPAIGSYPRCDWGLIAVCMGKSMHASALMSNLQVAWAMDATSCMHNFEIDVYEWDAQGYELID